VNKHHFSTCRDKDAVSCYCVVCKANIENICHVLLLQPEPRMLTENWWYMMGCICRTIDYWFWTDHYNIVLYILNRINFEQIASFPIMLWWLWKNKHEYGKERTTVRVTSHFVWEINYWPNGTKYVPRCKAITRHSIGVLQIQGS